MRDRLLFIDGHNLLWQMFCGMPSRIINEDGIAIQGTIGFIGALIKIIKMTQPTHLIVLFDGEHENSRTELLPEYKANRPDLTEITEDDNPFSRQIWDVYVALDYMNIKHTEVTEHVEADDVISSYAHMYNRKMDIVISSWDSDFFQLINENVTVLRYRGKNTVICDGSYIMDRYGIHPKHYADFKTLTGDNSDNIKGAEKVGIKTAAVLINNFGCLEHILDRAEEIEKPSIRYSIMRHIERLRINYKLIKLGDKASLPLDIKELTIKYDGISTREVLRGIKLIGERKEN